jgi:protocatechuate 3,4-dioxygenase alpha subunit
MTMPTPSQTVGPYFAIGIETADTRELVPPDSPDAIRIRGALIDGNGEPVNDGLIEIWQANAAGRYNHPEDGREEIPLEQGFRGFGRCATDEQGGFELVTVKPGPVPAPGGGMQAPHIEVSVLARGLLKRLATRIYFPDEEEANAADPVLSSIGDPEQRATLIARAEDGALRFDINLQGERETAFLVV